MNERDIFIAAVRIENPESRRDYLDEACGGDRSLRQRVEALLSARERDDSLLDRPPLAATAATVDTPVNGEALGQEIGPYKLREQIGEGGFGVVYVAEQTRPVRRKVALKVIKPGMDSKEVVARFEAERQALALMDHANIAHVLDAGTTHQGRPYFVMELVHGTPITEFCDKNNLPTEKRLELFLDVCRAIQHAHQKGIIHRDLKPNNVMVTLRDGEPIPKVIDFGVSKALSQQLTEKTIYTRYGQVIGTPQYMSPEQAEMSELGIDTRSDIYSLGVLLYELLTGATPVDPERIRETGFAEMMRIIREEEARRPSTRVSTMGEQATMIAAHRLTDAQGLSRLLSGELDWIVMKALDKNRDRRYETANHFAADVQRFLNDEAVQACPPSLGYRVSKTIRRHRSLVTLAASLAVMLCLGLVGTSVGLARANQEANRASQEAGKARDAERRAANSEKVAIERASDAVEAKQLANERADAIHRNLYAAHMALGAQASMTEGAVARIGQLTDAWVPKADEPDLRGWEWYYLRSRLHQDLRTLQFPTGEKFDYCDVSRDMTKIATGADDVICVWDAVNGQLIDSVKVSGSFRRPGTQMFPGLKWSPDGKVIAFALNGDGQGSVRLWEPCTGKKTRPLVMKDARPTGFLAWSPDGSRLACATQVDTRIVDVDSAREVSLPQSARSVSWSPDGTRLASGVPDRVHIWDTETGQLKNQFDAPGHYTQWSPDGTRLACLFHYRMQVIQVDDGRVLNDLVGHWNRAYRLAWSPNGKELASAGGDYVIRIWDLATDQQRRFLQGQTGVTYFLAWSPDGQQLASADNRSIKFWDAGDDPEVKGQFSKDQKRVTSVWRETPERQRLALADAHGQIEVWDTKANRLLHTLQTERESYDPRNVTMSPDARYVARPRSDNTISIWDLETGGLYHTFPARELGARWVAWSPRGDILASAHRSGTVELWEPQKKKHIGTLRDTDKGSQALAWTHDGEYLVTGREDGGGKVWKVDTREGWNWQGHRSRVTALSWSPDKKSFVSSSDDGIIVWDAENRRERFRLKGHTDSVLWVDWSPDGTRIASSGRATTVKVWDAKTGQEMITLYGHNRPVGSVEWNHDGTCLVSCSHDGITRFWDARQAWNHKIVDLDAK